MQRKQIIKILLVILIIFPVLNTGKIIEAKNFKSSMEYNIDLEQIAIEDCMVQTEKEYYLYFYKTGCPYCLEVSDIIKSLNNQSKVYALNCDIESNRGKRYDWSKSIHNEKEIGYINEKGEIIYYPGESEEKYLNSNEYNAYGHKNYYKIYSNIPDGQDLEMIYAKMVTPEINYSLVNNWNDIVIAGVPTLLHVSNGRIDKFYYDSVEIKNVLNSSN